MKTLEYLIGLCIKFVELFSAQKAAEITFELFQKTQPRKMLADEIAFYNSTDHYSIDCEVEPIEVYHKGPKDGELFIMLHGWNSNLARLSDIVDVLVKQGYYCVLFDMPGHGKSTLKKTNLKKNSLAFEAVLRHLDPQEPFNVLTHSFGSMVASFTLSKTNYQINHLIYLTVLNRFEPIFKELEKRLRLSSTVYSKVVAMGEGLLKEPISNLEMLSKTKWINFQHLSLLHDRFDKILPFSYSEKLKANIENSTLHAYEKIGHSRMLQNKALLKDISEIVSQKNLVAETIG